MAESVSVSFRGDDKNLSETLGKIAKNVGGIGKIAKAVAGDLNGLSKTIEKSADAPKKTAGGLEFFVEKSGRAFGRFLKDLRGGSASIGNVLEGVGEGFRRTFESGVPLSLKRGQAAFQSFQKSLDRGLTDVLFSAFTQNTEKTKALWKTFLKDLEVSFLRSLAGMAAALVQENLLAPLFRMGGSLRDAFLEAVFGPPSDRKTAAGEGLAKAALSAILPSGGGEGVLGAIAGSSPAAAALESLGLIPALPEAAVFSDLALGADIAGEAIAAAGVEAGAALAEGAAAAGASLAESASFLASIGGGVGLAAIGGVAAVAGGLILSKRLRKRPATPKEHGDANLGGAAALISGAAVGSGIGGQTASDLIESILGPTGFAIFQFLQDPNGRSLGVTRDTLIGLGLTGPQITHLLDDTPTGSPQDAVRTAARFVGVPVSDPDATDFHFSGDAVGRFLRKPSLRLVGEAGPEHILNVDSPPSIRALREGLRPIVRELFETERAGAGRPAVNVDLRGAFFPDSRSVEKLFRLLEDFRSGRRVSGGGFA